MDQQRVHSSSDNTSEAVWHDTNMMAPRDQSDHVITHLICGHSPKMKRFNVWLSFPYKPVQTETRAE